MSQNDGPNWVLFTSQGKNNIPEHGLLNCAERVWPIACASGRRQINTETSLYEKDRFITEAWEYVLFSIARSIERGKLRFNENLDLDAYLMKSFQHRLGRLMKAERMHRRLCSCEDPQILETLSPANHEAELDLYRQLQIQEIVAKMNDWTREVWNYLSTGSSWEWIANSFGMNTSQAKMKYRYNIEKIRLSLQEHSKDSNQRSAA